MALIVFMDVVIKLFNISQQLAEDLSDGERQMKRTLKALRYKVTLSPRFAFASFSTAFPKCSRTVVGLVFSTPSDVPDLLRTKLPGGGMFEASSKHNLGSCTPQPMLPSVMCLCFDKEPTGFFPAQQVFTEATVLRLTVFDGEEMPGPGLPGERCAVAFAETSVRH